MIDTHCHLTYAGLAERVDEVAQAARDVGVGAMVCVGTQPDDSSQALVLAQRFGDVYATAGLHPHYADRWPDRAAMLDALRSLAAHERVVALGEMGLDYARPDQPKEPQRQAFAWQLQLASEPASSPKLDTSTLKPLIIHNREATADLLAMLRDSDVVPGRVVFHCFTGSDAELDAILDYGAMVSFTGIVTFRNARHLAASAARVPLERIMIETDSPYLTPEPYRKVKTNEPRYVVEVARFLAQGRGMAMDEFTAAVDANAQRFFGLRDEEGLRLGA